MAVKINSLGAHVSRARLFSQFDQLGDAALKLLCQHVICIVAKTVIAQCEVGRVVANLLAPSTKIFEPDVTNSGVEESLFERLAIEMRQAPRHGKGANIHQGLDGVGLQDCDEFIQWARGMSDGV